MMRKMINILIGLLLMITQASVAYSAARREAGAPTVQRGSGTNVVSYGGIRTPTRPASTFNNTNYSLPQNSVNYASMYDSQVQMWDLQNEYRSDMQDLQRKEANSGLFMFFGNLCMGVSQALGVHNEQQAQMNDLRDTRDALNAEIRGY